MPDWVVTVHNEFGQGTVQGANVYIKLNGTNKFGSPQTSNSDGKATFVNGGLSFPDGYYEVRIVRDGFGDGVKQFEKKTVLRCIGFCDSLNGWAGSLDDNLLFNTKDGGINWKSLKSISEPRPKGICGLFIFNKNIIYGCGRYSGPAYIIKTTNGGSTWTTIDMNKYATSLVDCYFLNKDSGFVVGGSGSQNYKEAHSIVLFTSNGGNSWEIKYLSAIPEEICWKISFSSQSIGYVSIQSYNSSNIISYLKTTNSGLSWTEKKLKSLSTHYESLSIFFLTKNLGWIGGIRRSDKTRQNGETYQTINGGISWSAVTNGLNINRFRKINNSLVYAVGKRVYKLCKARKK